MQKNKNNRFAMAASAALLIGGCTNSANNTPVSPTATQTPSSPISHSDSDMGKCYGANSCKGASACATSNNSCSKQNTCRGKGWMPLQKSECNSHGGRFMGFKKFNMAANKKC